VAQAVKNKDQLEKLDLNGKKNVYIFLKRDKTVLHTTFKKKNILQRNLLLSVSNKVPFTFFLFV